MRTPPFRPFLAGAPQLVPGLKPIPPEAWLEPDTEAGVWLDEKRALMRSHRRDVFGAIGADAEMAELAAQVSAVKGEAEEDWPTPLEAAASLVSDDLCLLCSSTDGLWRLKAASLCAPTFWRLDEKLGEPLGGLHAPVPGANPGLVSRISRMFDALRTGQVLERFNWTVQAGDARFAPSQAASKALAASTPDEAALDTLFQRVERQTISKLPETGAVVFTIRIVLDPLRAVLTTPGDVRAFREAWAHVSPDLHAYKGWPAYDRLVAAALQRCAG